MKISLMVLSAGKSSGQALPINVAQFIIGRDPECNLRPASAMISKRHCAVIVKNEQVTVRDFDSTNGTFVNEQPIKGEVPLKDGDFLKVGPLSFKVVIETTKPTISKPTPPPKPRTPDAMDDDAAAALLSFDDDLGPAANSETSEDEVPGGSTVMDMPAFAPPPPAEGAAPAAAKPAETANPNDKKKPDTKAKHATGAAQDAAKAILAKLKSGRRGPAPEKP